MVVVNVIAAVAVGVVEVVEVVVEWWWLPRAVGGCSSKRNAAV